MTASINNRNIFLLNNVTVPKVYMEEDCHKKIQEYVSQMTTEIAWLGCVKEEKDEKDNVILTIYDVWAPPQEVNSASADIDKDGAALYAVRAMELGFDTDDVARYWGHSHVNMATNPSGTDDDTLCEMTEHDDRYFIMSIHNKSKSMYCALYLGNGMVIKEVPIQVNYGPNPAIEIVQQEIKDNVRTRTYQPYRGNANVGSTTTNINNTSKALSNNTNTHSGSGSNRQPLSSSDVQNRNYDRNLVGFRRH